MTATLASYRLIAADLDRSLALKRAERPVALESRYYLDHVGAATSVEAFLADTRLFTYAMTAFGLGDMAHAKGLMRKVLTEGVGDPQSFANRLADDRFTAFARAFDFAGKGAEATAGASVRQPVVDAYVRQALEVDAGAEDEGVRLALYFKRTAPQVASAYGLLADPALWKVVQTVLGLPAAMAAADIEKQAAAVTARLDIADLSDPEKLDRLILRFTAQWDAGTPSSSAPILALFDASAQGGANVGLDLAMTLRNLQRGG